MCQHLVADLDIVYIFYFVKTSYFHCRMQAEFQRFCALVPDLLKPLDEAVRIDVCVRLVVIGFGKKTVRTVKLAKF